MNDDCDFRVMVSELGTVVDVGRSTDNDAVVGNQNLQQSAYGLSYWNHGLATYLRVDIKLLAHKRINFSLRRTIPGDVANILPSKHVAFADSVPAPSCRWLHLLCRTLILLVWGSCVKSALWSARAVPAISAGGNIMLLASFFIVDSTASLGLQHRTAHVDSVVVSKVIESYVVHGVVTFLGNELHNAVATSVDGIVLKFHNCPGAESGLVHQIAWETRDRWNNDNHLPLLASPSGTQDALYDRSADLVLNRLLFIAGCRDEELILDVNEMLAISDDSRVSVRDRVLSRNAVAPLGTAAHNLTRYTARWPSLLVAPISREITILIVMDLAC